MSLNQNKFYYSIYGLFIQSDIEIKELVAAGDFSGGNSIKIIQTKMPQRIKESIAQNKSGYFSKEEAWFYVKDIAAYRILNGDTIEFEPMINTDPYLLRVYLTCSCLGFAMLQKDIVAIHGGTIVIDGKAVILTGDRGAGKSTLTTALRLKGYPFISDDVAAIEIKDIPMVKPGFPYQKLCGTAMENMGYNKENYFSFMSDKEIKYLVPAFDDFVYDEKPLFALCELSVGDVDKVAIEEIKGTKKIKRLIENRYRGEYAQYFGGTSQNVFKQLLCIAKKVKVYKITRPKEGFSVDDQVRLLEDKIKEIQYI